VADPTANPSAPGAGSPTSPLSVDEFASRVKAKYPEYQSLDNATLAQKVVAKYPEYKGKVALPDSANPNNTGIVGPDQTVPKPPPLTFSEQMDRARRTPITPNTSITAGGPAKPAPLDPYAVKPNTIGSFLSHAGIPTSEPAITEMLQGAFMPQSNPSHDAVSRFVEHIPIIGGDQRARYDLYQRGDKEGGLTGLVHKAASIVPFAGPALTASQDAMDQGDYAGSAGSGVNAFLSLLGLKGAIKPRVEPALVPGKTPETPQLTPAPARSAANIPANRITTPAQESAFNVLHPENAVAKESVLPEVRNAAAQQGVTKVPKGRAGVELPQKVIQGSIDNHEAQVNAIKAPYRGAVVDNTAVADAALSKITPEMRAAAAAGDSGVQRSISQIEAVATRARGANTIDLTDQLRHSWNDELSSELSKSAASQDVSSAATQAKRAAASALRSNMYDRLADLSGRDDVRALAQREGALIEAKAGLTKTANQALMSRRNDLGDYPRANALKKAALKVQLTRPATMVKAIPDIIQAVVNPEAKTPIGQYQDRVMRSLSNLGPATPDAPLYAPPQPAGLLGPGATPLGPSSIEHGTLAPPPVASTTRAQRLGVTPPSGAGFEHVPYNSQANASALPNAVRVPQQIGAGPNIRGLLPSQVESAIGLPEKSQSTLTNGRTIESPAANEGVIPSLVRDYLNRQNVSGHNSINGGSLEELGRGQTLKVSPKSGAVGVHGGSIDVGNGEAVLRQRPDGSLEVANNNSGLADSEILKRFSGNAAQTFGKPGRAPGTIELIHRSGEHGDVPASRVGDYLSSGEYRLAPRR